MAILLTCVRILVGLYRATVVIASSILVKAAEQGWGLPQPLLPYILWVREQKLCQLLLL